MWQTTLLAFFGQTYFRYWLKLYPAIYCHKMSGWSWLFFNHCSRHIDWLYKAFQKNELPNLLSNNLQNFDFINTMEKQYGVAIGDVSFLEMFSYVQPILDPCCNTLSIISWKNYEVNIFPPCLNFLSMDAILRGITQKINLHKKIQKIFYYHQQFWTIGGTQCSLCLLILSFRWLNLVRGTAESADFVRFTERILKGKLQF